MVRQLLHAIFAVLMWIVFVYYWSLVVRRPMNADTKMALTALAVLTLITTIGLCVWIYHNMRVFRKFRDRRRGRRRADPPSEDYLGRPLVIQNPGELKRANSIEVVVITSIVNGERVEQKTFKPAETADSWTR